MKTAWWTILYVGAAWAAQAATPPVIFPKPLSPRIANYRIEVSLDTARRLLNGSETLTWRNPSADVIRELRFHLYLNAFRDNRSTFMRESGGQLRGLKMPKNATENPYGSTEIVSIRRQDTGQLLTYSFIQPDDANPNDRTVIRVPLSQPVGPGQTIVLAIDFKAKLPKIFARTGYSRDFYLVGQWFPKIGVYEPAGTRYQPAGPGRIGAWNCHQFHADSEFYADYGVYDVAITVPERYWVSATGLFWNEQKRPGHRKQLHYHAEDVVDFAWTASPHFKVVNDVWQRPSGGTVAIELLLQPEHANQAARHLNAAKTALSYFDKHLGKYPFPNLTLVDPPFHAGGAGGMEYPTFITAGTAWNLPKGIRFPEIVTVHEFGHQYFMQLLASNEAEEAWLDEGFNQYYEGRIMDETYSPRTGQLDFLGLKVGDMESSRSLYVLQNNPANGSSFGYSWQLPKGQYGVLTYSKTATWMRTLEGLLGRPLMDEVMQTYLQRWQFKHPNARSFIDIVNELVPKRLGSKYGSDMNWFFEQALYGRQVVDYALASVKNLNKGGADVTVQRRADGYMPVDVQVHFEDGSDWWGHWDGKAKQHTFRIPHRSRAVWARVDPKQKIYMDVNVINNSLTLNPNPAGAAHFSGSFMFWVQTWLQWLAWLA